MPGLFQPAIESRHLAFTEARHVGAAPGVAAIDHLALSGDQGFDAQAHGNRCGHKAVGRGDDHQLVACVTVLGQQGQGFWQHDRLDAIAHVVLVPLIQRGHLGAAEHFQTKVQVGGVIQLAGQVILIELIVARLVGDGVEEAALAQVIAPGVVAVAAQKGVVQVE